MDKVDAAELEKVKILLRDIQLDQFYRQIHGKLHINRLSHFQHVTVQDLDDLGMAKPEQRRLFEALKKARKKSIFSSFRRKKTKSVDSNSEAPSESMSCYGVAGDALTCLISEQSLTLYEMLGNGAFGYVRRGKWAKDSRKKLNVAVKCLKAWSEEAFQQMQMEFIKEANAMSLLDHPHIIRLHGIVLSVPMMLVTELAPLGCLLTQLRDKPHNFTLSSLSEFVVQIASGMAYLESHRFVHRDLATRNLLLESYDKVKIGDFGMMRVLSGEDDHYTMHPSGKIPFAWCPQEVLKFRKFSHASDVWAFGITVVELFSYGMEPWPGLNGAEVLDKVDTPVCERPKKPDHCPADIYNILIACCWAHEPHQRASFSVLKKMTEEVRPVNAAAVFPYESKCKGSLAFKTGDIVTLLDASPDVSWWKGQNMRTRQIGMFPAELVDSGIRRAVSPPSHPISPKQRSTSKQTIKKWSKLPNCDCGSAHIYETPVLLDSAVFFRTNSTENASRSSGSVESDFTSSVGADSGYSSSVDTRRSNLSNGENSPKERKGCFVASYQNTSIVVPNAQSPLEGYVPMSPASENGPVSHPIPIPKQMCGEPRYVRREHNVPTTPVFSGDKCPLDFSSLSDVQLSAGNAKAPVSLGTKTSASLSDSSASTVSNVVSPQSSKKTPPLGGGRSADERLASLQEVVVPRSNAGSSRKHDEDDIYVELSRPLVDPAAVHSGNRANSSSSRDSLKGNMENSYENHCFSQKEESNRDNDYVRLRSASADQPLGENLLMEDRGIIWPAQHSYDNHKLRDDSATVSDGDCYDNHNLRSEKTSSTASDLCYDNWKIKNATFDESDKNRRPPCYENVEVWNGKEKSQDNTTFDKRDENKSSRKANNVSQSYENCLPKPAKTSYENFTPRHLQDNIGIVNQESRGKMLDENCEGLSESLKAVISRNGGENVSNATGLSCSLPENSRCIDVVSDTNEAMSIILEKRSLSAVAKAGSASVIEQINSPTNTEKESFASVCFTSDSGGGLPVPPPRWKRIARLSQTRSLDGCSPERWSVAINPEIASALRKWRSGTADCIDDGPVVQDSQVEVLESDKPYLPSRVKDNKVMDTPKHPNLTCNAYENVMLRNKMTTEEIAPICPPELPLKKKQPTRSKAANRNNATTRALHYENVDIVNGFHVVTNGNVAPDLEKCAPPPLPRKMSRKNGYASACGITPG